MSMESFVFINSDDISIIVLCINCIFGMEKILADDYPNMRSLNLELERILASSTWKRLLMLTLCSLVYLLLCYIYIMY
jgi:hypothetical protein